MCPYRKGLTLRFPDVLTYIIVHNGKFQRIVKSAKAVFWHNSGDIELIVVVLLKITANQKLKKLFEAEPRCMQLHGWTYETHQLALPRKDFDDGRGYYHNTFTFDFI